VRTFVVPDLHGNHELLRLLLREAHVPLTAAARSHAGVRVVQLGDLVNCVAIDLDADLETLERAQDWLDLVLLGNHEYPYFGGPSFGGFWYDREVDRALHALAGAGLVKPCERIGDTLLTHAGVTEHWGVGDALSAATLITSAWDGLADPGVLRAIGWARGGQHREGGITWSDWSESRAPFPQVHGHTPHPFDGPLLRMPGPVVDLDVGGSRSGRRLVGLWLDEQGSWGGVAGWGSALVSVALDGTQEVVYSRVG
jgi:Calcineurin-like phosphoesterase